MLRRVIYLCFMKCTHWSTNAVCQGAKNPCAAYYILHLSNCVAINIIHALLFMILYEATNVGGAFLLRQGVITLVR